MRVLCFDNLNGNIYLESLTTHKQGGKGMRTLTTGIPGLDAMFDSGLVFPEDDGLIILVRGGHFGGKTVLAAHLAANYVTRKDATAIHFDCRGFGIREHLVSTYQRFNFGRRVSPLTMKDARESPVGPRAIYIGGPPCGINEFLIFLDTEIKALKKFVKPPPTLYIVDGLDHIDILGNRPEVCHWQKICHILRATGCIVIITETETHRLDGIVDVVIELDFLEKGLSRRRTIQVFTRTQPHYLGKKILDIDQDGITVK